MTTTDSTTTPARAPGTVPALVGFSRIGADRLAYAVARLIQLRRLDSRSEAGDALLDYLEIGQPGGPKDVLMWMDAYEANTESEALT